MPKGQETLLVMDCRHLLAQHMVVLSNPPGLLPAHPELTVQHWPPGFGKVVCLPKDNHRPAMVKGRIMTRRV